MLKQLIDAGYRKCDVPPHKGAAQFCQKCVRDADGRKLYFLDVYKFEYGFPVLKESWQMEMQFQRGDMTVNVTVFPLLDRVPLEDAETFAAEMFEKLGFDPYGE